jgi:hypothetical protein
MEWCARITHKHPKGITLSPSGRLDEWVIRGFRHFTPLFKERKKVASKLTSEEIERCVYRYCGQIFTMGILTATWQYNELIAKGGLTVNPTPSWEAIDFSNNVDEMECARHLTVQGVTIDEALDMSQYTFTWLEHSDKAKKDTQVRILINALRDQAKYQPEAQPWPDNLTYEYNTGLVRWMPILPTTGTTQGVVPTTSVLTILESTATPSLTGTGNPSL